MIAPAPTKKNRRDPKWRARVGFDNIASTPSLVRDTTNPMHFGCAATLNGIHISGNLCPNLRHS